MDRFEKLYTKEGEQVLLTDVPWNEYPRPKLKRDSFLCLNGKWQFDVLKGDTSLIGQEREITVPYSPETLLSGIGEYFDEKKYDHLYYRKEFNIPDGFVRGRVILHFEAVSNYAEVVLNGKTLGIHRGAYDPFSFDITEVIKEKNIIEVYAKNVLSDRLLPYGKQSQKRGGMWYTPTSGIWQTVWLESAPFEYIKGLKASWDGKSVTVTADGADNGIVRVLLGEKEASFEMRGGKCTFGIEEPRLWSPETPYLYEYSVETAFDRVESYFTLRTLEIKEINGKERLCLNGKPYFFHGLLDQGYWSDGGLTPPSAQSYTDDILAVKSLGFNMLRKHIKLEMQYFYYLCDKLGIVVFQDMVNNGNYSFFRDTALPTIGLQRLDDTKLHRDASVRTVFEKYMYKTVDLLGDYSCIFCWTIFNEGWGQFCGSEMYAKLKEYDPTRFIDTASGWFSKVDSDVDSKHIYFKKIKPKSSRKPIFLSEFGGYSYRVDGHIFNKNKEYGYGKFSDRESFANAFCKLYKEQVLPFIKEGLCAAVYTQVSDVEDETNGLLTYDRRVTKVLPEEFLQISEMLKSDISDN